MCSRVVELRTSVYVTTRLGTRTLFFEIQPSAMEKPIPPRVQMGPHLPLFLPGSSDDEGENNSGTIPPVSRSASDDPRSASEEPRNPNNFASVSPLSDSNESDDRRDFGLGSTSLASPSTSGESDGQRDFGLGSTSLPSPSISGESDGHFGVGPHIEIPDSEESDGPCNFGLGSHLLPLSGSEESDGRHNFRVGSPIEISDSEESDGRDYFHTNAPVSLSASKDSEGMNDFIWPLPTLINIFCSHARFPATFTGTQRFPPPTLLCQREGPFCGGHSCPPIAFSVLGSIRWCWKLIEGAW